MQQPKHMEEKKRKDQLQAVWFAAGMAVVIACLERAVVLSIFEQWRVWVFLALNLLLIAILFTSQHSPIPPPISQENDDKTEKQSPADNHREGGGGDAGDEKMNSIESDEEREKSSAEDEENSSTLLSNEELNERVEAFISRFRQQYLVSDVKISRTRSHDVCGGGVLSTTITV